MIHMRSFCIYASIFMYIFLSQSLLNATSDTISTFDQQKFLKFSKCLDELILKAEQKLEKIAQTQTGKKNGILKIIEEEANLMTKRLEKKIKKRRFDNVQKDELLKKIQKISDVKRDCDEKVEKEFNIFQSENLFDNPLNEIFQKYIPTPEDQSEEGPVEKSKDCIKESKEILGLFDLSIKVSMLPLQRQDSSIEYDNYINEILQNWPRSRSECIYDYQIQKNDENPSS